MKTIYTLNYNHLTNPQHFNFADFVKAALTLYALAGGTYNKYIVRFLAAFEAEDEAYQKYDRKTLSARIAKQNQDRIIKFRLLRDVIDAIFRTEGEQKRLAAERLQGAIDLYGGGVKIPTMGMDALTGVLTNLIEDFEFKYPEDLQLLGIEGQVQNLNAANEEFKALVSQRTQEDSELGKEAMALARAETDRTLRMLFTAINLDVEFGDADPSLEPFINYLNVEIDRYRILIGQGVAGGTNSGGSAGDESSAMRYIIFKYNNGTELKLWFEVGEPIVAPENTPGYEWKDLPEVMPKRSRTVKEVPIDSVKYTATFHFLDHSEEEIKAVAGAELIAPENTTGCVWEPEVPATMPAEDTTYNEVLAQNNEQEEDDGQRTVTFTFANGETEVIKGEPGEALTYPTNTAGYIWSTSDSNPSKIPAQNFRVIEVPDNVPLFTIVWFTDPTTPIQWFMLPVGHEVPAAPAAPAGDPWSVTVTVMPDHNLYILPESMAEEEEE